MSTFPKPNLVQHTAHCLVGLDWMLVFCCCKASLKIKTELSHLVFLLHFVNALRYSQRFVFFAQSCCIICWGSQVYLFLSLAEKSLPSCRLISVASLEQAPDLHCWTFTVCVKCSVTAGCSQGGHGVSVARRWDAVFSINHQSAGCSHTSISTGFPFMSSIVISAQWLSENNMNNYGK